MISFGTGGWRAIIGDDFTRANVQLLTKAIAKKMKAEGVADKGFCIGYDRRFLSVESAHWAAEVLAAENIPTMVIDRDVPTPVIMFTVKNKDMYYGMAVTASHNPAIYNGIKVFTHGGRDADETVTNELEKIISEIKPEEIQLVPYQKALDSGIVKEVNPLNDFIDSIIAAVDMDCIRSRGLKIVLDPMYGVSKTSLETILYTARCDVEVIHERHDTLFGGRLPAPNVDTLNTLRNMVREKKSDIGIATDGDADRLGVIDDTASFVHPNQILVMLYYYLVKYKGWTGPAVRNIATTHMLDKVADAFGQKCYEVPVGFKHVSAKMTETNAVIGGESSGGLTVRGHISGKDGIYAAMLLVEMIAKTGKQLSQIYKDIVDEFGALYMAERDYRFTQERKAEVLKMLMEDRLLPEFPVEVEKVSYLDGCKVYFKNGGWIIARFSGTEPLIRIFCEMPTIEEADAICDLMKNFLGL